MPQTRPYFCGGIINAFGQESGHVDKIMLGVEGDVFYSMMWQTNPKFEKGRRLLKATSAKRTHLALTAELERYICTIYMHLLTAHCSARPRNMINVRLLYARSSRVNH